MYAIIYLKKGREEALGRFHPWIFSGAVASVKGAPHEGDVVEVRSAAGTFLALGHYQAGSIAVRVLAFEPCRIDAAFWLDALQRAYRVRQALQLAGNPHTTAYRLVHGEGDFLPGLVIDIYGAAAVMQAHSAGMFLARKEIAAALQKIYGGALQRIYDKSAATVPFKAGLEAQDEYLLNPAGTSGEEIIMENGLQFIVHWEAGQKTGFFLDQRDNRQLLAQYAKGRNALNLFCYTGGFSAYALRGGAAAVHSVDSSSVAIDLAVRNAELNNAAAAPHHAFATDAFEFLHQSANHAYDLMIIDPPAFAKHTGALKNALQAYKRLNVAAFSKIAPGGIVFTFSCSQVVSKTDFRNAVFSAAAISKRRVRILHQLTQPADHPVNIYHPEGEYLKGLALLIE
ncbi:MAG: class I SAM-dependent rRNA methyltransferase [Prevotellaceae bacterium]|jgi:23S rRNA (cytosine1962-C5)-methyltransferase|nr:class I SAM-dependent rRNA methyltransferase [Prevotellaceae bacterium]